jgi:hypothetical protein
MMTAMSADADGAREARRVRDRAYYAANADAIRRRSREWHAAHREESNAKLRAKRAENPERTRAAAAKHRASVCGRIGYLVANARRRAEASGVAFDPGLRQHLMAGDTSLCRCCGRQLDYSVGGGTSKMRRSASPSLDRMDNSAGYTPDNVFLVCMRCNLVKSDASVGELRAVLEYMTPLIGGDRNAAGDRV